MTGTNTNSSTNTVSDCGTYGYGTFQDNGRELARLNFQAEVAWQVEQGALCTSRPESS